MEALSRFVVKHRRSIIIFFLAIAILNTFLTSQLKLEYDLTKYLPNESNTSKGVAIMRNEFGLNGSAQAMVKANNIDEALAIKQKLLNIDGVSAVVFTDEYTQAIQLGAFTQEQINKMHFKDGYARYIIAFDEDDYSNKTNNAVKQLYDTLGEDAFLSGSAINVYFTRNGSYDDVINIVLAIIPVFFLILFLMLDTWLEPIIIIFVMVIALIITLGTSAISGSLSFMSLICLVILLFAISMDYSIFLLHRFAEEKKNGLDLIDAMTAAVKASFSTLLASCLTTVAGMLSLVIMKYKIGYDIGFVLAKGVALNLLACLTLLPSIILVLNKSIEKTRHKRLFLKMEGFSKGVLKNKFVILAIFLILVVPAFYGQNKTEFLYGGSVLSASSGTRVYKDTVKINEIFGVNEPLVILVPNTSPEKEYKISNEFKKHEEVGSVQGLYAAINPSFPLALIPEDYKNYLISDNYSRIILNLKHAGENPETFALIEDIKKIVGTEYDNNFYLLGESAAAYDIKNVSSKDYLYVNIVCVVSIFIILALTFKKLLLPILLILVIQSAIWVNMAIPYFTNMPIIFIGYIVVSSLQLGATIDYAILLTTNYLAERKHKNKTESIIHALNISIQSILTSAGVLTACGFLAGLISQISGIAELATLVGRGALLSCIAVIVVLPCILYVFDRKKEINK
ncbi:MAG: MMPL family transporter [Christensenellaceae bacterium]|nr:MMPL family transporter [Christensenellaceae bacterium]